MSRSVSECLTESLRHLSAAENHVTMADARLWPVSQSLRDEVHDHGQRIGRSIDRVRRAVRALEESEL